MPGHDFEKAVQERSRELRIEPSPAVWEAVSRQLEQKRRRRGLAWLFFGMILLIGTGGGWWWMNESRTTAGQISLGQGVQVQGALGKGLKGAKQGAGASAPQESPGAPALEGNAGKVSSSGSKVKAAPRVNGGSVAKGNTNSIVESELEGNTSTFGASTPKEEKASPSKQAIANVSVSSAVERNSGTQALANGAEAQNTVIPNRRKGRGIEPVQAVPATNAGEQIAHAGNDLKPAGKEVNNSLTNDQIVPAGNPVNKEASQESRTVLAWDKDYRIAMGLPSAAVEAKVDKGGMKKMSNYLSEPVSKQKDKQAVASKWLPSLRLAIGGTALQEGVLEQYSSMANEYLNPAFVPGVLAGIQRRPSEVKVGPSIQVGAGLERKIGKKTGIAIGIQYAYVSNKISIGNKVDSSLLLFNQRQQQVMVSNAYYGAGDNGKDHYNRYHFIQLPVDFYWNFDRKQRWSWSTGFSLGYLVGADALQYNYQGGIYYKDNSSLKKFQAGIQTAVTYKLFDSKGLNLAVGPTGQYILTSMDKSNVHKHFLFIGLGAKLNWNRK